jgi:hypothetical protein
MKFVGTAKVGDAVLERNEVKRLDPVAVVACLRSSPADSLLTCPQMSCVILVTDPRSPDLLDRHQFVLPLAQPGFTPKLKQHPRIPSPDCATSAPTPTRAAWVPPGQGIRRHCRKRIRATGRSGPQSQGPGCGRNGPRSRSRSSPNASVTDGTKAYRPTRAPSHPCSPRNDVNRSLKLARARRPLQLNNALDPAIAGSESKTVPESAVLDAVLWLSRTAGLSEGEAALPGFLTNL